jgi:hypothetical protein
MHELAKTGRWLGGNTPTGYESESISNMTVDGKTRKACRLKIIPDEINLVNLIFDKFTETGSLTKTDEFLMNGHYKTKRGKNFTRFAIKAILSNPVYMIADEDAYHYLLENEAELFSQREAFDGKHGIMAYNRTLQRPGKATLENPIHEWIVSVGKHQGTVPGAKWIQVQNMLGLNKSKSYRKPRSHVALLSGLLCCGKCGGYMRPKLSERKTASGETIYTYLCTTKERSRGHICNMKNVGGNMLDAEVIEAVKSFGKQSADTAKQIAQAKKRIGGNHEVYEAESDKIRSQIEENEKEIKSLITTLGKAEGSNAEKYIIEQIDELHSQREALKKRLSEIEAIINHQGLDDIEFDIIRRTLSSMCESVDNYTVEQKRAAVRTFIRKIIWDGENAHIYLFCNDSEYEFPEPPRENSENSHEPSGEDSK